MRTPVSVDILQARKICMFSIYNLSPHNLHTADTGSMAFVKMISFIEIVVVIKIKAANRLNFLHVYASEACMVFDHHVINK